MFFVSTDPTFFGCALNSCVPSETSEFGETLQHEEIDDEDVDLAYGQLRPHGASYSLIQAVRDADENAIITQLQLIENHEFRDRLINIIQRLGLILGKNR